MSNPLRLEGTDPHNRYHSLLEHDSTGEETLTTFAVLSWWENHILQGNAWLAKILLDMWAESPQEQNHLLAIYQRDGVEPARTRVRELACEFLGKPLMADWDRLVHLTQTVYVPIRWVKEAIEEVERLELQGISRREAWKICYPPMAKGLLENAKGVKGYYNDKHHTINDYDLSANPLYTRLMDTGAAREYADTPLETKHGHTSFSEKHAEQLVGDGTLFCALLSEGTPFIHHEHFLTVEEQEVGNLWFICLRVWLHNVLHLLQHPQYLPETMSRRGFRTQLNALVVDLQAYYCLLKTVPRIERSVVKRLDDEDEDGKMLCSRLWNNALSNHHDDGIFEDAFPGKKRTGTLQLLPPAAVEIVARFKAQEAVLRKELSNDEITSDVQPEASHRHEEVGDLGVGSDIAAREIQPVTSRDYAFAEGDPQPSISRLLPELQGRLARLEDIENITSKIDDRHEGRNNGQRRFTQVYAVHDEHQY